MADIITNSIAQASTMFPALTSDIKAAHLKDSYKLANTAAIVVALEASGWAVSAVSGGKARTRDPRCLAHGVRLTHTNAALTQTGEVPQLVLRNAHDGTSALTGRFGFYRFACANATVVGSTIGHFRILHRDYTQARLLECIGELMAQAPKALEQLTTWKRIGMSDSAEIGYLGTARALRWSSPDQSLRNFGKVRRSADNGDTLYDCFQRAQEDMIKGGVDVCTKFTDPATGRITFSERRARAIGSLSESLRINTGLWDLTTLWAQSPYPVSQPTALLEA
jgi:hypothetical protein